MCYCESDAVNVMIHVRARRRYPGIKFHSDTLARVAATFRITDTLQLRDLDDARADELARAVVRRLPSEACPAAYRREVA